MKLTLSQVLTLSLLGLAAMLGVLFLVVTRASRETIVESSERIREGAGREISDRVERFLEIAPSVVRQVQAAFQNGLVDPREPLGVETTLLARVLAEADLAEVTFTYGRKLGFDAEGDIQLAPEPRGQLSVIRLAGPGNAEVLASRFVHQEKETGDFVAERRELIAGQPFGSQPWRREPTTDQPIPDPTSHLTFTTPASREWEGKVVPSDLHWSQLDEALPKAERRVEVSVQQAITDATGEFVGVLRVGLLVHQLDRAVQIRIAPGAGPEPHRIFLCDERGELITRGVAGDRLVETERALRIAPAGLPPELVRALQMVRRHGESDRPPPSGTVRVGREDYLTTFRRLSGTQDWVVGIVVPRSFYLGRLSAIRRQLLLVSLGLIAVLITAGGLVFRGLQRAHAQIVRETLKMRALEFAPSTTSSSLRDVAEVLEGLEQAKTAVRAMGKYVPIDLVRRLYQAHREPMLGGELMEISVMFTDIKDFTSLSERMDPDELAMALGDYLQVMARVIQQDCRGTIDKYIGDAIMTIWNAPEPVPEHARLACRSALLARTAAHSLMEAPAWGTRPTFETRFGLHLDTAFVGHFGSPERLSYTAIGNGINLASRLEGLNKQYGTSIIASEAIRDRAGGEFAFRLLDYVAVKGKDAPVSIYELLGPAESPGPTQRFVAPYERAFQAYLARDFSTAATLLQPQEADDEPSRILLARCQVYEKNPPPDDWQGIHVATEK